MTACVFKISLYIYFKDMSPSNSDDLVSPIIYIYIYIVIHRLFRWITTLQCGQTHEIRQAGVETWITLRQSNILSQSRRHFQRKRKNFFTYNFQHTRYRLHGVFSFEKSCCISVHVVAAQFPPKNAQPSGGDIYILSSKHRLFCCITTLQCN